MKDSKEMLRIVAGSDVPVLLLGESGAGKEVAARFVHRSGPRERGPFIALNCAAIATGLMESILEGAKRGSFTGASMDQLGVVRAAEGGTLFLDEIGELPLSCQGKLLRILQEKAVLPVGSARAISVNFRLICATNRNLQAEMAQGRFREDLFYRINTFPIEIPPLRERADFPEVARDVWHEICGKENMDITAAEINLLQKFTWPGNIRQLKNVLLRYQLLKRHGISLEEILAEEFAAQVATNFARNSSTTCGQPIYSKNFSSARKPRTTPPSWNVLRETLVKYNGNKSQTASELGISRGCVDSQIRKWNLES
ncbi:MAG: sigma 54-interacting transcriptional regulator [Fibrobacter sp.]|nr:sigma 54-interacting transcriptional regulator [Fibrobacter sp.]